MAVLSGRLLCRLIRLALLGAVLLTLVRRHLFHQLAAHATDLLFRLLALRCPRRSALILLPQLTQALLIALLLVRLEKG